LADRFVLEVALIDYGPVLLRIPFGSRLAAGTLSSEAHRAVASGPPWLSPAFAFVPLLHTFLSNELPYVIGLVRQSLERQLGNGADT
jgi:hypothetical protein